MAGRVYWVGQCDWNHSWTVVQEAGEPEPSEEAASCSHGHEAATWSKQPAADRYAVSAEPAARIADRVTGRIALDREYFIRVTNVSTGASLQTARTFPRAEVPGLIQSLLGLSPGTVPDALARLDRG